MEQEVANRARDLAIAIHETFLGSGSEDVLSPRFQSLDIRSAGSPRTPRTSGLDSKPPLAGAGRATKAEGEGRGGLGGMDEAYLKDLSESEFDHHESGAARLNNGSFGTCPKSVLLQQEQWLNRWMSQPDAFYYETLKDGLLESRRALASYIRCPSEQVALLDNVTEAASVVAMDVMWSFVEGQYKKGDAILLSNFTYKAVRTAFEAYAVRAGAHVLLAEIPFPLSSSAEILSSYEGTLREAQKEGRVIRLAVLDHVVSMPSIIIPVKALVALCRKYGVERVFVDGAQAMGNLEVNVQDVDADYYTANLHKWFFSPSTVAFFHCKAQHLTRLHHPIVSAEYGKGFVEECEWVGTRDYSAMLAVPAAFEFIKEIPGGLEAVQIYNHNKVVLVGEMLAKAWGTYCGVAPDLCASMVMVALPLALGIKNASEAEALRTRLRHEFSVEIHTFTETEKKVEDNQTKGTRSHLRISHHIYNKWDEYLRLRDAINALVLEKAKQ